MTNNDHYREIINDHDERLVNMYRVFQTDFDKIFHILSNTLYSESEYRKARKILRGEIESDDIWKAWAYFISIQQSFATKLYGGWGRNVYSENSPGSWSTKIKSLEQYKERVENIYVSCDDALKVIKQFDSPQTFFYCDPPYPNTCQGHYSGYSLNDFKSLIKLLSKCKGSAIVSCYPNDEIIPKKWKTVRVKAIMSSNGKGRVGANRSRKATKKELGNLSRIEFLYIKKASRPRIEIRELYKTGKYDCFTGDKIWEA